MLIIDSPRLGCGALAEEVSGGVMVHENIVWADVLQGKLELA